MRTAKFWTFISFDLLVLSTLMVKALSHTWTVMDTVVLAFCVWSLTMNLYTDFMNMPHLVPITANMERFVFSAQWLFVFYLPLKTTLQIVNTGMLGVNPVVIGFYIFFVASLTWYTWTKRQTV